MALFKKNCYSGALIGISRDLVKMRPRLFVGQTVQGKFLLSN
ncbi:hypothetical protein SynMITS9220_01124 [Synechococcus sp. MIT S9220]|nr:hypothetical protein SynMITS9220_01124 [Synechococcus sp. MIT S9220]